MLPEYPLSLGTARSAIRELFEYGKQRAAVVGPENVFDFSIGNPSVPPPECVNATIKKLVDTVDPVLLHGYTSSQGDPEARRLIAENLNARFGSSYSADNLFMTVGAAASLCCCFYGLANKGDEIIVLSPYFPEYTVFLKGAGIRPIIVPADTESFQINFDILERSITEKTAAVLINSPNNPSGVVYSEDTLRRLSKILQEKSEQYSRPIYLISDEPYREISFDKPVPWVPDFYDNSIICYSFSKSLSLPGERIGYVLVPDSVSESRSVYASIAGAGRMLGYVCAPAIFQKVAGLCCGQTSDITVYKKNRDILYDFLTGIGFSVVKPDGTFYIFPKCPESDANVFAEKAKALDLLFVPGDSFGCAGHVRISYCVPTETVLRSLPAFEKLAKMYF